MKATLAVVIGLSAALAMMAGQEWAVIPATTVIGILLYS
jgi:hypothetical protein